MDSSAIDRWLDLYQKAWKTGDPADIFGLFSSEARYYAAPYREPKKGVKEIVAWWLGQDESAIPWSFEPKVIAQEGGLFVVRGVTRYPMGAGAAEVQSPEVYHNLWLVTLDETGRASEFVEYWMLAD